ncbi:MAG: ParB/RepB/Spo0J family partition protein [Synergistaceae bacterium]|jgi:ParB-like chromosome segregation protein Spo0J|nr:ParB/RepB/Spo0J family partition protein [Synergistaceae bacterium]
MPTLFATLKTEVIERGRFLAEEIDGLPFEDKIEALNAIRAMLHEVSPFRDEPVDCVTWVPSETVEGNDYNPNAVAPPEMRLLELSIKEDGYTQPVVTHVEEDIYRVVDGFHRTRIARESPAVKKRILGYLPVVTIRAGREDIKDRMAATIRHNRARGVHGVRRMADIVAELYGLGWTDSEIAKELGMDADEVLRFKQTKGLPELFKNQPYSKAWE